MRELTLYQIFIIALGVVSLIGYSFIFAINYRRMHLDFKRQREEMAKRHAKEKLRMEKVRKELDEYLAQKKNV